MRQGLTLMELAAEVERQSELKRDFIAPVGKLEMIVDNDRPALALKNGKAEAFRVNDIAHQQIAEFANIPQIYYRKLAEQDPKLLAVNVNRWIHDAEKQGQSRMVRTLDGTVRALVSDRFRCLDNYDVLRTLIPVLKNMRLMVMSSAITARKMYLKCVSQDIEVQVPTGKKMGDGSHTIFDCLQPALAFSNSEVGHGAYEIESGALTRACTNLAWFSTGFKKYHTGARADVSDEVYAMLSDETKAMTDAAVWAQTKDVVVAAFDRAKFEVACKQIGDASAKPLEGDIVEVVEKVGRKVGLNETERKGVLQALVTGADLTVYGLSAAVTRFSQETSLEYDRSDELEHIGGQIITLSPDDYRVRVVR